MSDPAPDRPGLPGSWEQALEDVLASDRFTRTWRRLHHHRQEGTVYPPAGTELLALQLTPLSEVEAVILGQDPYHGPGQAHGLAFSVPEGVAPPPSLRNIFRELEEDCGVEPPGHGCLESWARDGVLLLNTILTVRAGEAGSHADLGWQWFTDRVIESVVAERRRVVFLLWGNHAREKSPLVREPHATIESTHPSPLSAHRGFFGSRPFSRANRLLEAADRDPIDWRLE